MPCYKNIAALILFHANFQSVGEWKGNNSIKINLSMEWKREIMDGFAKPNENTLSCLVLPIYGLFI
jgi:hypothetical protein